MLGASGTRMRQTVVDMVINFVSRLPDIEQYCFSDGMPFAAPDALAWIERCKAEGSGGAETDGLGQVKNKQSTWHPRARHKKPSMRFRVTLATALQDATSSGLACYWSI